MTFPQKQLGANHLRDLQKYYTDVPNTVIIYTFISENRNKFTSYRFSFLQYFFPTSHVTQCYTVHYSSGDSFSKLSLDIGRVSEGDRKKKEVPPKNKVYIYSRYCIIQKPTDFIQGSLLKFEKQCIDNSQRARSKQRQLRLSKPTGGVRAFSL